MGRAEPERAPTRAGQNQQVVQNHAAQSQHSIQNFHTSAQRRATTQPETDDGDENSAGEKTRG